MKKEAILHIPMSEYGHAISEKRVVFRLRTAKNDIKSVTFCYGDRACRQNPMIFTDVPMKVVACDLLFDYWEAEFDTLYRRLCYYFKISDGFETVYYYGDLFYDYLVNERSEFFQLPYLHKADIACTPDWVKDAIVYNIFPDSFATGNKHISRISSNQVYKGNVINGKHGGTIKGITENVDYFLQLGINCVYINPIFTAGEYHKYDLLDYYSVDPCFGTNEHFKEMVQVLHSAGIRVIIDGVFNHCGWYFFAFDDVVKNGEKSRYKDWFYRLEFPVVRPACGNETPGYECFAYERLMPKLDTTNEEVRKYFFDVCRYWIREYDIDGWRFDCADEVDTRFWRDLKIAAMEAKPDVFIMGEVWHNANFWLDGSMFHSTMNYYFRKFCREFFAERKIDAEQFNARVTNMLLRYRKNMVYAQLNLLDSHDVSRFLSLCQGDITNFKLAVLFQMCFVGIPSIFYGDEQGITGLAEEEYRTPMIWDGNSELHGFYQRAILLRKENPALKYGTYNTIFAHADMYVFAREHEGTRIIVSLYGIYDTDGDVLWEGENFLVIKQEIEQRKDAVWQR